VSTQDDSLRRLADVFQDMAGQIYARERRLRQQINTLKGILLLLAVGVIDGLSYPLSKIAVEIESNPIGLAFWINFIAALARLPFAVYKKSLPKLTWPLIRFFCIWGFVTAIACEVLLSWVVDALPASLVSIIVVTEGFIVFIVAGVLRIEKLNSRRFIGIIVGLAGIAWSIILLGESLSLLTLIGLAVIIVGSLIVGPQEEEEPELELAELPAK